MKYIHKFSQYLYFFLPSVLPPFCLPLQLSFFQSLFIINSVSLLLLTCFISLSVVFIMYFLLLYFASCLFPFLILPSPLPSANFNLPLNFLFFIPSFCFLLSLFTIFLYFSHLPLFLPPIFPLSFLPSALLQNYFSSLPL